MTGLEISDFKMFKESPFEPPDSTAFIGLAISALKEEEKTYGPVFSNRLVKYALQYESQQTGEEPPKDIENLDQLAEYLLSKLAQHPKTYHSIVYAQFKTENEFQGKTGAGTRLGAIGLSRSVAKGQNRENINIDLDDLLLKYREMTISIKVCSRDFGYKLDEEEGVVVIWPYCYLNEVCRFAFEEGLLNRIGGGMQCGHASVMCQYFKLITGYEWDYGILESHKPHCIARSYIV
ncbi:MAG: hypothetical protein ACETWM_20775 [Candidatus Lokiarchaeia archaeon]